MGCRERQANWRAAQGIGLCERGVQPRRQAHRHRVLDKTARLWDAETGKPIGEPLQAIECCVRARRSAPTASASSPHRGQDGAGVGRRDRPAIGEPLKGHEGTVRSAAFSPDGKRIVTASDDKTARVWDAETGKPIGEPLKGHEDRVLSAAFSPDGKRIVTASGQDGAGVGRRHRQARSASRSRAMTRL